MRNMKSVREKIALVGFLVMLLAGAAVLVGYIVIGHSWNVAASVVDEAIGGMDGYTVVLYEGTEPNDITSPQDNLIDENAVEPPPASVRLFSAYVNRATHKTVKMSDVIKSYEDKGAEVLVLDSHNIEYYREGMIVQRNGKKFGIFCITQSAMRVDTQKMVQWFNRCGVDCIIALTPNKAYVEAPQGIGVVISTKNEDMFVMGETINNTFYVDTTDEGKVGAVILSPTNVPSGKVITQL